MAHVEASIANDDRKKAAVFSHERSGTHFAMNTLALNFGYIAQPWWNLDYDQGLNFHAPSAIREHLAQAHGIPVLNVLKSHHSAEFIEPIGDYLADQFHVFYICRDPRDTMVSFWKHIRSLPWDEGPRPEAVGEFLRAAPAGGMLRYQKRQANTMVHRWARHVEGWLDLADRLGDRVTVIRYEDLNLSFDDVVRGMSRRLGLPVRQIRRPATDRNVVGTGQGRVHAYEDVFTPEDDAFVVAVAGRLMERMAALRPLQVLAA